MPPNSKILLKKGGKYLQERGVDQNPQRKEIIKKETESKQPPKETCSEAYHNGPNKTPPAGKTDNQTAPWIK